MILDQPITSGKSKQANVDLFWYQPRELTTVAYQQLSRVWVWDQTTQTQKGGLGHCSRMRSRPATRYTQKSIGKTGGHNQSRLIVHQHRLELWPMYVARVSWVCLGMLALSPRFALSCRCQVHRYQPPRSDDHWQLRDAFKKNKQRVLVIKPRKVKKT